MQHVLICDVSECHQLF